jgi:predicted ribosomally synthesized peptide with nif11-like leader
MKRPGIEELNAALRQDAGLRTEIQELAGDLDALLRRVEAKGFGVARQELEALVSALDELSDDELEQAAGGDDAWGSVPKP